MSAADGELECGESQCEGEPLAQLQRERECDPERDAERQRESELAASLLGAVQRMVLLRASPDTGRIALSACS